MPVQLALMSTITAPPYGLFLLPGSCLLDHAVSARLDIPAFEIIKDAVGSLTDDRRLQAMLIASRSALHRGAAGSLPVAICSGAMLAGLGFDPSTPLASVCSPTRHRSRSARSAFR